MMIERVHEHIIEELQQNARTDTVSILTAIFLNSGDAGHQLGPGLGKLQKRHHVGGIFHLHRAGDSGQLRGGQRAAQGKRRAPN